MQMNSPFMNQFDKNGNMQIIDGMRYYKKTDLENNVPRFSISLDEPVSETCLQYAAKMAMERCRTFRLVVVADESSFYLRENTKEPIVHKDTGKRHEMCNEANNGHMTWIGYKGDTIILEFFHGVSDGMGIKRFAQILLYYYFEKKCGTDFFGVETKTDILTTEDPREYADSLLFVGGEVEKVEEPYRWEQAFQLPEEHMESAIACQQFELCIDGEAYDAYVKKMHASRLSVFATFMNQSIAKQHGMTDLPIMGAAAVNARGAYQAEETMQCCVATVPIWYDKEIHSMSMEDQLKSTKNMVRTGLNPDYILNKAMGNMRFNQMLKDKYSTLREKQQFCRQITKAGSNKYTYGISFLGDVVFGKEIDSHITKTTLGLCANTASVILEITKQGATYYISYCTHLKEDPYVKQLQNLFIEEGIPCECKQLEDYVETRAYFDGDNL